MQRTIRRLGTAGLLLVAFATIATQAQAATAPTATTESASNVTALSASLNGSISTGGLATDWQFQYGTSTSYGKTTPTHAIAAGKTVVAVNATVVALKPGTVYHFRVVATAPSSAYYYFAPVKGADKTFKTPPIGTLKIGPGTLTIKRNATTASVKCSSTVACKGTLALTLSTKVSRHKTKVYRCASTKFSVAAGKTSSLKLKVSSQCVKLLKKAPHRRLKGTLSAKLTSGQPNTSRAVTLKYVS